MNTNEPHTNNSATKPLSPVLRGEGRVRGPLRIVTCFMLALAAAARAAEDRPSLSLATAEALYPTKITATGRVQSLTSARISSRVSGTIIGLGEKDQNPAPDVGMRMSVGQVLFRLDPTTFQNALAVSEAAHKFALANYENLKAPMREERIAQLDQALVELDARIADKKRDEERYHRLVEVEKSLPARRLEEVHMDLDVLLAQRKSAEAKLREAKRGPTATELAVAEAQVTQAEAALKVARKDLDDTSIKAPFTGVITRRFKSAGDYITNVPPTEVIELVATDRIEVELRLPEAYYPLVKAGQTPIILRSSLLSTELNTTISRVVSEIDSSKGTFAIRVAIPADKGLVPGAFIAADISFHNIIQDVIVPMRAVASIDGKSFVFIAENGQMSRKNVELGDRLTEGVVVKSGLAPGAKVIIGPAEALKDKAPLPADLK